MCGRNGRRRSPAQADGYPLTWRGGRVDRRALRPERVCNPATRCFAAYRPPAGVAWNPFHASHGGKMAAARGRLTRLAQHPCCRPGRNRQRQDAAVTTLTRRQAPAVQFDRGRGPQHRRNCRRVGGPLLGPVQAVLTAAWSAMPVTPPQLSLPGSSSLPTSPAIYSSTSTFSCAASMPADSAANRSDHGT